MCESKVYLVTGSRKEKIADEAVIVREEGDGVVVLGLMGEKREVGKAHIVEVDARRHVVVIKRVSNDEGIQD